MDQYLTTDEAAEALSLPKSTLMRRIYKGQIKAERKGWCWYVTRQEVDRVLAGRVA